jgi:uncharacterized MAPEG superfamily protein
MRMMNKTLMIVAEMAAINWLLIVVASLIRARAWTPLGMLAAFGNREGLAEAHDFAGRTERAAKNMLENLVFFTALALVAVVGGVTDPNVELGARIFYWARIIYIPIYMIGVPYLRTGVWLVSVVGLALIFHAIAGAAPKLA